MSVIEGAMGLSTNIIQIRRLNSIVPCRDCQHCDSCKTAGRCVQDDDLTRIVDDIRESDAIILCIPMYFGRPCASYYSLEDRLYSLIDSDLNPRISPGKKLVTVVTCDNERTKGEEVVRGIESLYCETLGFESVGSMVYESGFDKDSARNDPEARSEALELGRRLNPFADLERTYYDNAR